MCFDGTGFEEAEVVVNGGCEIALLDIVHRVRTHVIGARQLLVAKATVLRQRLDVSTEAHQGGSGVESFECLFFH